MTQISIRQATVEDVAALAPLFDAYRQFYEEKSDLSLAQNYLKQRIEKNQSTVLLAESGDGTLAGFCQLYPTFCSVAAQPIFVLYDLFVLPDARAHGVGRSLLHAAEAFGRAAGAYRLDLSTAKTNTKAQSVYEALDWVRDSQFFTYSKVL